MSGARRDPQAREHRVRSRVITISTNEARQMYVLTYIGVNNLGAGAIKWINAPRHRTFSWCTRRIPGVLTGMHQPCIPLDHDLTVVISGLDLPNWLNSGAWLQYNTWPRLTLTKCTDTG